LERITDIGLVGRACALHSDGAELAFDQLDMDDAALDPLRRQHRTRSDLSLGLIERIQLAHEGGQIGEIDVPSDIRLHDPIDFAAAQKCRRIDLNRGEAESRSSRHRLSVGIGIFRPDHQILLGTDLGRGLHLLKLFFPALDLVILPRGLRRRGNGEGRDQTGTEEHSMGSGAFSPVSATPIASCCSIPRKIERYGAAECGNKATERAEVDRTDRVGSRGVFRKIGQLRLVGG